MSAIAPAALSARAAIGARVAPAANKKAAVARNTVVRAEKASGVNVDKATAAAAFLAVTSVAPAAHASELGEDLFSLLDTVDKAADKVEAAFGVISGAAGKVGAVFDKVTPIVKPLGERAVSAAAPVGKALVGVADRTLSPVISQAEQTVESAAGNAVGAAGQAIKDQGIDVEPAVKVIKGASSLVIDTVSAAVPSVTGAVDFVTNASPTDFVELAVAAGALYIAVPALGGLVGSVARGYAGDVRPVEAYDMVLKGGNIVIVDVRRDSEVDRAGEVDFPRRAAGRVRTVPREKLQGNFKSIADVEANLTAIKIASLSGIKKGTKVLLIDSNGGDARKVAAALSGQGFGSVYTVEGGFSGWTKAGLGTKATNVVTGQVLPALGLGGGSQVRRSSGGSVIDVTPTRALLPGGRR